jgi:menaquinone-dependent protoporphyrinogen oxidase
MKTLILYASKHGATAEIARRIADKMGGTALHDLKGSGAPDLAGYDCIIVGSAVYAGMILKEAKEFVTQNTDILCKKQLGLFICGLDASRERACLEANIPRELMQSVKAARHLGGIFDPKKANVMERFIIKAVAKQSGYSDTTDEGRIVQFTQDMMA